MQKQFNIRHLCIAIISIVLILTAVVLAIPNTFGRYSTKISTVLQCVSSSDIKLYIKGLYPTNEQDITDETKVYPIDRDELTVTPSWQTVGGEQFITFSVANSTADDQPASRDISFRVRVIMPDNNGTADTSELQIDYSTINFSLESEGKRYYSRIDNIHPKTEFGETTAINGWMYRFCETIDDEILYTLNGKEKDEITFTLSVYDTEFDCSNICIYIDRIN